jgi:hypothetical protein
MRNFAIDFILGASMFNMILLTMALVKYLGW